MVSVATSAVLQVLLVVGTNALNNLSVLSIAYT